MVIYNLNKMLNLKKKLVAKGRLQGKSKTKPVTVLDMSKEDYQDMVSPLLFIFRTKRNNK